MSEFSAIDIKHMHHALRLANVAKGRTFPNPAVGAVIVLNNQIEGVGATQHCGGSHAEKVAIKNAMNKTEGATLYVTLEPCCHFGRTAPCTDAIIDAKIKKVVVSVTDPNPLVAGKGIEQLRSNGIEVVVGLLGKESARLNEDFFWGIMNKKAWITLKLALTLDGRIADGSNISKWITGEKSRTFVHELRRCHSAVAVGRATLDIDDPHLTVRHKKGYNPARIIFSSDTNIPENSYFFKNASNARSIVVVRGGNKEIIKNSDEIELWYTGENNYTDSLHVFTQMAYEQGLTSIFVEGGQKIASQLLESYIVNRIYLFYGNRILGSGKEGILFDTGLNMQKCISLDSIEFKTFNEDVMVSGLPQYNNECK
jgi:diaminohydroxyphosphoribosylaminopyrimidine deaminase/5-amino-6-(5-phosphoribosylamino)uracil reductase